MNKNLSCALIASCVRLLNHLGGQIGNPQYADIYGFIGDVAVMLDALQNNQHLQVMHPDVLAEALAYECKREHPDPTVIMELAYLCKFK